jgi:hypothetical protein
MSTLRVSNIGAPGAGTVTNVVEGVAKVWVNFNALSGTPIVRDSFNVASMIDSGVGAWRVNFSTTFQSMNYSAIRGGSAFHFTYQSTPTPTQSGVGAYDALNAAIDIEYVDLWAIGDLA